ncbi:hypothetical protein [Metaclostridioides mangenotii]|uniref:hypothetical protein n=1 Tax=Metaclostridioides mangenotii TaxID=1540 RepID=UPI0028EC00C4|nr:hypothetical protein [Clostridioides mangenotii]
MSKMFKRFIVTAMTAILISTPLLSSVNALESMSDVSNNDSLGIELTSEQVANANYYEKEAQVVIEITDTDLIINGEVFDSDKLESLLETAQEVNQTSNGGRQKRFAAAAGVYFIPGVGQVALAASGAIVVGGITIGASHWAYKTIKNWLNNPQNSVSRAYGIPKGLLDKNGNVKLGNFNQKVGGKTAWKDPKTGYIKEKDTAGHAGKKWKIKDKKGVRKASTDGNGKIISK